MVVGSDRVKEFKKLLDTYNGVTGKKHGFYKFRTISVISAHTHENVTQMQRVLLECLHQR